MIKNVMKNEKGSLTGGPRSGWGDQQPPRPARERGGRSEEPGPLQPVAGAFQLPIRALGADVKGQDLAPNSGDLFWSTGAAAAPNTRESRGQVCSRAFEGEIERSWPSRGRSQPRKMPWEAASTRTSGRGVRALELWSPQPFSSLRGASPARRSRLSGPRAWPVAPAAGSRPALVKGRSPVFAPPPPGAANRRWCLAPREVSPAGQQAKCE